MRLGNSYAIYKGKGALRFSLTPASFAKHEKLDILIAQTDGAGVYLEAAPGIEARKYDWEKKISFRMDHPDIGAFLAYVQKGGEGKSLSLIHDPKMQKEGQGQENKTINLGRLPGSDKRPAAWGMMIAHRIKDKEENKIQITISDSEMAILTSLLNAAIPLITGWYVPQV